MNNSTRILTTVLALIIASFTNASAQWSSIGSSLSSSTANYVDAAVDNNGNVYVAYIDAGNSNKVSVKKWNGTSWSTVGNGISSGSASYTSIDIDQFNNNVYVAYRDNHRSGRATVRKYNGSSWSDLGNAGFTTGSIEHMSVAVDQGTGEVICAYKDNNRSGRLTCAGYYSSGNYWYAVGNQVGFSTGTATYVSVAINSSGHIYIAYKDHSNSSKLTVKRMTGSSWSTLGTSLSAGSVSYVSAAFNGSTYYVAYSDGSNSNKATVRKYSSSWSNVGSTGFTPSSATYTDLAFNTSNEPLVVYSDAGNGGKASVMKYSSSSWSNLGSAGFSSGSAGYTAIAVDGNNNIYTAFKDNSNSSKLNVMNHGAFTGIVWDGSSSSSWTTAANWVGNNVPTSSDNVLIPSGLTRYPNHTSNSTLYCKDLIIQSGASVTLNNSSAKLRLYGDVDNSGTFNVTNGKIEVKGSSAQTITTTSAIEVDEFKMDNSTTLTITGAGSLVILDKFDPKKGKTYTNDKLVLKSTSSRTGRIYKGSTSGNYIVGKVTVQRYVPGGRRAFRFLSHPFSSSIKLSQITDDIDITGQGGTTNGFTQVQVNAPSAFWFDVNTADNSTAGNNPGWKAFTSANTASWDKYEMARILFRGSKGQGLTQGSYTPNAVTLDMIGDVNQGNKTISISKGSNSDYIIVGNPYPCQVDLKKVSRSNVSSNFCVWNPNQGTMGGYTAHQFSSSFYLPVGGAFVTKVSSGSSGTFYFEEGDKKNNTPASLFKGTSSDTTDSAMYIVELSIEDSNTYWDRMLIEFDSVSVPQQDSLDMEKLYNPDLDIYSVMKDSTRLSIDVRPYENGEVIPLGIVTYKTRRLAIRVPQFEVPQGAKLYLHDKYLNKIEPITKGFEYWFDVTNDPKSMGNERFAINMGYVSTGVSNFNKKPAATMRLFPNPATNVVNIMYTGANDDATIKVLDVAGKVVYAQPAQASNGRVTVQLNNLPNGMYIVELKGKTERIVEKLIKQ